MVLGGLLGCSRSTGVRRYRHLGPVPNVSPCLFPSPATRFQTYMAMSIVVVVTASLIGEVDSQFPSHNLIVVQVTDRRRSRV